MTSSYRYTLPRVTAHSTVDDLSSVHQSQRAQTPSTTKTRPWMHATKKLPRIFRFAFVGVNLRNGVVAATLWAICQLVTWTTLWWTVYQQLWRHGRCGTRLSCCSSAFGSHRYLLSSSPPPAMYAGWPKQLHRDQLSRSTMGLI